MRRQLRIGNELPVIVVVLIVVAGLLVVNQVDWERGLYVIGAAFLVGGLLRLTLPTRRAGLLAVRARSLDVAVLLLLGVGTLVLSSVVPPPR